MIVTLLATMLLGAGDLTCAVMGSPAPMKTANSVDFGGVRYTFCCGGCDGTFSKDPAKFVKKADDGNKAIGFFLFEPIAGTKIDLKKVPDLYLDSHGTRYFFASEDNKKAFAERADKWAKTTPAKEVLYCSVMGHEVKGYTEAGAFADHEGVRYYFCCGDCRAAFVKEPAKYTEGVKAKVQEPKALKPTIGS